MITAHRIEIPTPYPVGSSNCYLIAAEPLTLVDAGINTPDGRVALDHGLGAQGAAIEDVRRVLITHAHPDHFGLVNALMDSGATVFFPEREIERIRDRQTLYETGRLLMKEGVPFKLLMKMDRQRKKDPRPHVDVSRLTPIADGRRFDFSSSDGSFQLVTRLMPGHTGGHVVFLEEESRILFAGDQLLPKVSPNPLLEPALDRPGERRHSLKDYMSSLEAMAAMDLTLVYPGHGGAVADPSELISRTIAHHVDRTEEVAAHLGDDPRTAFSIARDMYPNVSGYDVFLAVSEIVAHLDLVIAEGRAAVHENDGVNHYLARSGAALVP